MTFLRIVTGIPGIRSLWTRFPIGSVDIRTQFGIWPRPAYAYGVYAAATQARALGMAGISVLEFGVAGGRGLVTLEHIAAAMAAHFDIEIAVAGFDSGKGMPAPIDFRDLPHVWGEGFYSMDEQNLRLQLKQATLKIGDVRDTAFEYVQAECQHPIGFISFDLDYYSSTKQAFHIFDGPPATRLPRIYCYFDDTIWPEQACYNEFTGEYLAIREFNDTHADRKICQLPYLRWLRPHHAAWNEQIYVMHDFNHPQYSTNITPTGDRYRQLTLK